MEILFIFILLLVNGMLSLSEISVITSRRARLTQKVEEGNTGAQVAIELAEKPGHFLATVQIGLTVTTIISGAIAGASIATDLARLMNNIAFLRPYSGELSVFVSLVLTSYASLIIAELVPKRIAFQYPEVIAPILAPPMRRISQFAYPFVWFLSGSTDLVIRLLGIKPNSNTAVTEEEIHVMIHAGTQAGIFDETEQEMVTSIFRLDDLSVKALMTPRRDVAMLDVNDTTEQIILKVSTFSHSRYAVTNGTPENIVGVVRASDLLCYSLQNLPINLQELSQPPLFIPESATAADVLAVFRRDKQQFGFVIDEEGSIDGIITLHDILEAVVGDIENETPITEHTDGSFLVDGTIPIDDFKDLIDVKEMPEEDRYNTLAGFIVLELGKVPSVGDAFVWDGYRFEVTAMDGHRVHKVLITPHKIDSLE